MPYYYFDYLLLLLLLTIVFFSIMIVTTLLTLGLIRFSLKSRWIFLLTLSGSRIRANVSKSKTPNQKPHPVPIEGRRKHLILSKGAGLGPKEQPCF